LYKEDWTQTMTQEEHPVPVLRFIKNKLYQNAKHHG